MNWLGWGIVAIIAGLGASGMGGLMGVALSEDKWRDTVLEDCVADPECDWQRLREARALDAEERRGKYAVVLYTGLLMVFVWFAFRSLALFNEPEVPE